MMDALLTNSEVSNAVQLLKPGEDREEVIARSAWSVIAEPGDGVAGALIAALGAPAALRFGLSSERIPDDGAANALDVGSAQARKVVTEARARWRVRAMPSAVADALRGAAEVGAQLLLPSDAEWPTALNDLREHAPCALWVRGDAKALSFSPRVAIVGARAASPYGEHVAAEIAGDLAATGVLIVSGGAYGIDGAAHRAAIGAAGATVAFLAGGVDRAYPAGHQRLFQRIVGAGAVVSELPCGAAPTKWRFLARNRLIAALGDATVVVEAGWRSGSLNTAGHAASLGRPLGTVPGPVTSAASAGCHRLLREYDARCVTNAAEVRELWGEPLLEGGTSRRDDPERMRLLDAMSLRQPHGPSELARRSGLSVEGVTALLGLLALEELVQNDGTGWRRSPPRRE